ncbi:MAG TPA: vitamin K epoxide reductase family protein [Kofleriaceae bacterium]|nr:vitamin K epoxide reductase family protein [Kofleriaceae bacterium]
MTGSARIPVIAEHALRFAAAVGLGISVVLARSYLGDGPSLCGEGGGCDVVRESPWAWPLGIPMPILGAIYFAAILVLSGLRGRARLLLPAAALAGGAAAVGFLYLQAEVVGAWCRYCLVADSAALLIALAALPARRRPGGAPPRRVQLAIGVVGAAALVIPLALRALLQPQPPPVTQELQVRLPPAIAAEQQPGVVTIVEYLDFQCPVCRALHARLTAILPDYPAVRVVRKMDPLSMHRHAEPAARSWCCADAAGLGDRMADALMTADALDPSACAELAAGVGVDADQFRACFADDRTAARVHAERAEARGMGIRALPTFWIGREKFVGLPDEPVVRASLERAVAALQ